MDATPEEWRPVVGYEGLYEVSDQGRVRSLISGRILRPATRRLSGHKHVMLCRPSQVGLVHQLVAAAFLGPRPDGAETRHLNGDSGDNRAANLQYGTRSENTEDSKRHGTHFHAGLTHCKRGHELTGDNLQKVAAGNKRTCLACRRERARLYKAGTQVTQEGYCINGHPKTPENRYTNGPGHTRCKPCALERRRAG